MKRRNENEGPDAKRMVPAGQIPQGNAPILSFQQVQSVPVQPLGGSVPLIINPVTFAPPPTLGIKQYPPATAQFPPPQQSYPPLQSVQTVNLPPGFASAPPGFESAPPGFESVPAAPQTSSKKKKKKKKKRKKGKATETVDAQSETFSNPLLPHNLVPLDMSQQPMFMNYGGAMGGAMMVPMQHSHKILSAIPLPSANGPLKPRRKRITKLKPKASDPIHLRYCAGETWVDRTLTEWPENDFRIFCGDLGNEVSDAMLTAAFSKYPSFAKAKVIRDKRNGKSRGFGFVSFLDPQDFLRALKEMNGKYVGNRPVKLKKSNWKSRTKSVKDFKPGMRPSQPTKRYDLPGPV